MTGVEDRPHMPVRGRGQRVSHFFAALRRLASGGWSNRRLTTRLMFIHGCILVVVTVAVFEAMLQIFIHSLRQSLDSSLHEEMTEYRQSVTLRPAGQDVQAFTEDYFRHHLLTSERVLIVRFANGTVLGSAEADTLLDTPTVADWLGQPPAIALTTDVAVVGENYRVLVLPTTLTNGDRVLMVAGTNVAVLREQIQAALTVTMGEAVVAILVALASTFLVLRHALGTVGRVTDAARAIGQDDLSHRVGYHGADDEVGRLARTFDEMLERIDRAFQGRRQLLSDVSHQLRTPLTAIRGHLEVLQRGGFADRAEVSDTVALVLDELDHVTRLVNRLLLLGRALELDFLEIERVDLRSFVMESFEAMRNLAPRRWALGPVPNVVVWVDREKLRGALFNLVDNAVKATGPEDFISLDTYANGELVLAVADSGQGIPYARQATVFQRFVHGGEGDGRSTGLGLAIVKAVAEAHGGRVSLESTPGRGCVVRVVLPGRCIERGDPVDEE